MNLLKSKLYSLQESNGKSFTKEGIEIYLHNLKNRFNEKIDRSIIELFVKDIKIFPDNIIVTLRKLPKLYKGGDPNLDPFLCDKLTITVNIDNNYMKISQE
mgnify:FL=1